MKIALCLSGQPRGLPVCLQELQKGLDIQNMDVFLHTWFDENNIDKPYETAQLAQYGKVGKVHPQTKELLLDTLKPIDYIIEPQKEFPFAREFRSSQDALQEQMASIFYSIYMANALKKKHELLNSFKYDLVIRARYDLWYEKRLDILKYITEAQTMIVTAEKFQGLRNNPNYIHGWYTMTDIFAYSTSENMDIFSSVYPHMSFIYSQLPIPYGENYLGYRVRIMGGLQVFGAQDFNYEILHRVMDINNL